MSGVRTVPCPHCQGPSVFAPTNPYRPFCSVRCREQDLGDWGNERFRIPASPPVEGEDSPDPTPASPRLPGSL